ncbi:MAG: hypothetical protein ACR2H1_11600 [Limisphaerales bacterium]
MKTISFKVDEATDNWLESEAKKLGRTKSDLAREALERHQNGWQSQSIHQIMKDVCGSIKGGPRDLSTNKKYLKGFGRDRRSR